MIAIQTKYLGATNHRGSRIRAFTCNGHSKTINYDNGLNTDGAHFEAVKALCTDLGWSGQMVQGGTKDGSVWVWLPRELLARTVPDVWTVEGPPDTKVNG